MIARIGRLAFRISGIGATTTDSLFYPQDWSSHHGQSSALSLLWSLLSLLYFSMHLFEIYLLSPLLQLYSLSSPLFIGTFTLTSENDLELGVSQNKAKSVCAVGVEGT